MDSKDTLYYADYSVLFVDRPTYDEWEGELSRDAVLCGLFGIVYWYAHVWRMGRPFFNILKTKITVLYGYIPHPMLVPWSWKSRAIRLLPLMAVWPVQSHSACTRVHCTFALRVYEDSVRTSQITQCASISTTAY